MTLPPPAAEMAAMRAHAESEFPRESCGLVVGGAYRPCRNVAEDPEAAFQVPRAEMAAAGGSLQAVVHSHPGGPRCPSEADMRGQMATAVPWGIVPVDAGGGAPRALAPFFWGDGSPPPPLVGRPFRHGVTDCYSLARDFYRLELGVALPDYPRSWGWWLADPDQDLYMRHFASAGFREVDGLSAEVGDIALMQVRSRVANHAAVYLGSGMVLHQLGVGAEHDPSRLSCREPVARWRPFIRAWIRHGDA